MTRTSKNVISSFVLGGVFLSWYCLLAHVCIVSVEGVVISSIDVSCKSKESEFIGDKTHFNNSIGGSWKACGALIDPTFTLPEFNGNLVHYQ